MIYYVDTDTEDDFGEPVPKRSRRDEEDKVMKAVMMICTMTWNIYFLEVVLSLKLTRMNGCLKVQYTKLHITKYISLNQ